jgi:hypothetical protein
VPREARISAATRVVAEHQRGQRLSDHDLYATEWALPSTTGSAATRWPIRRILPRVR